MLKKSVSAMHKTKYVSYTYLDILGVFCVFAHYCLENM